MTAIERELAGLVGAGQVLPGTTAAIKATFDSRGVMNPGKKL